MFRHRLSAHFWLDEFTRSEMATRHGLTIDLRLDSAVAANLRRLCHEVLEPVRGRFGPVRISSGYRPPQVNALVGGARDSQHTTGQAADIVIDGISPMAVCAWIMARGLPFDQLIQEHGRWTHVSVAAEGEQARRQVLTAVTDGARVLYRPGLAPLPQPLKAVPA
jgi:zinc D-Ala-D-Ala carboxypeptidase